MLLLNWHLPLLLLLTMFLLFHVVLVVLDQLVLLFLLRLVGVVAGRMKIKRELLVQGNEHGRKARALIRLVIVIEGIGL
jgi:hypothetical protein